MFLTLFNLCPLALWSPEKHHYALQRCMVKMTINRFDLIWSRQPHREEQPPPSPTSGVFGGGARCTQPPGRSVRQPKTNPKNTRFANINNISFFLKKGQSHASVIGLNVPNSPGWNWDRGRGVGRCSRNRSHPPTVAVTHDAHRLIHQEVEMNINHCSSDCTHRLHTHTQTQTETHTCMFFCQFKHWFTIQYKCMDVNPLTINLEK